MLWCCLIVALGSNFGFPLAIAHPIENVNPSVVKPKSAQAW